MTGTANDAIPARDGEYDPIEYHGKYCCGCWTDPYKTEVNHKSRKFDKGQLVELK
jgi:hypothetical protein